jgi:UDP:flavonoid glycosyltransferase YjiC (YdhE family)
MTGVESKKTRKKTMDRSSQIPGGQWTGGHEQSMTSEGHMGCNVLYVSGSLGLGHVTRDLAIATEMRRMCPDVEITWIAGSPASDVLVVAGERLAPEQPEYRGETDLAEAASRDGRLSLTFYVFKALAAWLRNARLIGNAASRGKYDVIVGNETYEIVVANFFGVHVLPPVPFVMMYDFWGMEVTSGRVLERIGAWMLNLVWSQEWRVTARGRNAAVFFGEIEDIPDRRFGVLLPHRRRYAQKHVEFVGYPLPFDLQDVPSKAALRNELGYGNGPLVICTVGGTSIGRPLLELCAAAFPLVVARVPDLHLVLVGGPRIDPASLYVPENIDCRGMIPQLWHHLAACDLAVVQGGGATTLEVEALRVPFLFFPVENQSEQEITVAGRLARHGAGVRMQLSSTSPGQMADAIIENLGVHVSYPETPSQGVHLAARRVLECAGISAV